MQFKTEFENFKVCLACPKINALWKKFLKVRMFFFFKIGCLQSTLNFYQ